MKIYLSVPYEEKDQAKKLGAKWDPIERKWYAPEGQESLMQRWSILPPLTTLVGEDRSFGGNQLFVDLIPSSCWFTNVRYCVASNEWDRLRTLVYERSDHKCECCGVATDWLEAHERWHFDTTTKTQKLMRIIALCEDCHEATHMGLANIRGRRKEATQHLIDVTKMTPDAAEKHIDEAFALWEERNKNNWELDLSLITNSGIILRKKPEAAQRQEIAKKTLTAETADHPLEKHQTPPLVLSRFFGCAKRKRTAPDGGFDSVSETKRHKSSEDPSEKHSTNQPKK